ncbi:MAG: chemotaxis protein CheW, partial [Planctomycetota bacterium]
RLPLTLAIIPSLLIRCQEDHFALPQVNVVELVRIPARDTSRRVERVDDAPVIRLRGELLPLIYLRNVLNIDVDQSTISPQRATNIAVVMAGDLRYGLVIDEFIDSAEIVVKPLGKHIQGSGIFAGATILGDGSVAFIMDVLGISRHMSLTPSAVIAANRRSQEEADKKRLRDQHPFIVVENAPGEHFAIPLGMIAYIRRVPTSAVESIAGQTAIQLQDTVLPVLGLDQLEGVAPRPDTPMLTVLVFHLQHCEVGLLANQVLDSVATHTDITEGLHQQEGIFGSCIINQHICLVIDICRMVQRFIPSLLDTPPTASEDPRTILVVDDSSFFRNQISYFLMEAGYQTCTASDGLEALSILHDPPTQIGMVVST